MKKIVVFFKERLDLLTLITFLLIFIKEIVFLHMLRAPNASRINFSKLMKDPFESLFVTPDAISFLLMILMLISLSFLFKNKIRLIYSLSLNLIVSLIILMELWYYRGNYSFLSIKHIMFNEIFNPLGNSLFQFNLIDIVFFIDLLIIVIYLKVKFSKGTIEIKRSIALALSIFIISALTFNHRRILIDKKGEVEGTLFRNCWVPFQTMLNTSPIGFIGFDIYNYYTYSRTDKLTKEETSKVDNWLKSNKEDLPDNTYKGKFKGKNIIFIQVESLENFVIGQKVNGQEITPNLNKLLKSSLYFNNIYEQNNTGFSSDCDLLVNTGLFPKTTESVAYSRPQLDVYSFAEMMNDKGYNTFSSRPEEGGNWNWSETHKGIYDFDTLIDVNKLEKDDMKGINLSDKSYFRQLAEETQNFKEPYYSLMVTITSHAPFSSIKDDEKYLNLSKELDENYLGKYFQSVNYTDKQIGKFIEDLDKSGELDNTVIAIYGDHTGVHKTYLNEIQNAPLEGDWWKEQDFKIPLIVYSKDMKGEVISTKGGQVDFYPTFAYLMGSERNEIPSSNLGRILVNTKKDFVLLANGTIIGETKSSEEKNHIQRAVEISELMIKSNYFPRKLN